MKHSDDPFCPETVPPVLIPMASQAAALGQLQFAVRAQSPVMLFTGASGSGKSRLVEELFDTLPEDIAVVIVSDPASLDGDLRGVLGQAISEVKAAGLADGQVPLLIIDDAQKLLAGTLAQIIRYADPDVPPGSAFKLLLVGPLDFDRGLRQGGLLPMVPVVELAAASDEELRQFVAGRLEQLGARRTFLTSSRVQGLVQRSKGNLTRIDNVLRWHLDRREPAPAGVRSRPAEPEPVPPPAPPPPEEPVAGVEGRGMRRPVLIVGGGILLVAVLAYVATVGFPNGGGGFLRRPQSAATAAAPDAGMSQAAAFLPAVAALPDEADRLYRAGLASDDPVETVADLARAALLGHARAAYFLGQIYEGGEGVPANPALAMAWYREAATDLPRAGGRADALASSLDPTVALAAPEILHAERRGGSLTVVWADMSTAPAPVYRIEFHGAGGGTSGESTPLSAQTVTIPASARSYRVIVAANDATAATQWFALPAQPLP